MLKSAKLSKEISLAVANKVGILADISKLLLDAGVNIEAVAGYAAGNEAKIMLVTADVQKSMESLKKSSYASSIKESEVLLVELENKPGALKLITAALASGGIDIKQIYGTACTCGCPAKIVFSTSDNKKALALLNK